MSGFEGLTRIDLRDPDDTQARTAWQARCRRNAGLSGEADEVAAEVIDAVAREGDAAVLRFIEQFEGRTVTAAQLELDAARRRQAAAAVPPEVRKALGVACEHIVHFHRTQEAMSTGVQDEGVELISRAIPLRRVAVYAPGGTAAYPSSVLMTAVVAKVAGVAEVFLLTPQASDSVVLAAELAGVDRIFEVGGAQAVAAAALGTDTIPRVDKIVGPGNAFVTAAKRRVFGLCDIDGIAGPSEIMILADRSADPELVAADLISQAEHDVLACPILVTDEPELVPAVDRALVAQLADLPRVEIATKSLSEQGAAVLVSGKAALLQVANAYAPEHLELLLEGAEHLVEALTNAGAVFVGASTPEAAGDYTAGPSHVLPTAGAARFQSALGIWDFVKYSSVLRLSPSVLASQAEAIMTLARAEGLEGHARAVQRRLEKDS